jgi:hypothetical protein
VHDDDTAGDSRRRLTGVVVRTNRGGRCARAWPDGKKQRARHSGPRLGGVLLGDEAPLSGGAELLSATSDGRAASSAR